jgi:hypothetical protein
MDLKNVSSNGGNVAERISKSMQFYFFLFFFLKIVKIEPTNKVQSFFFKMRCLQYLQNITFHFTNQNGMNQSFLYRYGSI